jgi:hypothetical protein
VSFVLEIADAPPYNAPLLPVPPEFSGLLPVSKAYREAPQVGTWTKWLAKRVEVLANSSIDGVFA